MKKYIAQRRFFCGCLGALFRQVIDSVAGDGSAGAVWLSPTKKRIKTGTDEKSAPRGGDLIAFLRYPLEG
jgi:hypothetical protein